MYSFFKKKTKHTLINIGTGNEMSINRYAKYIMSHLGVNLKIIHKDIKFDGTYRKLIDSSLARKYGWKYKTKLDVGLSITINDYLKRQVFINRIKS